MPKNSVRNGIVITGVSPGDTYMVAVTPTGSFMVIQ